MSGQVPTIGLPLMMEFRCYPDSGALGLTGETVSLDCREPFRRPVAGEGQVDRLLPNEQVAIALNPVLVRLPDDRLGGRPNDERLFELRLGIDV